MERGTDDALALEVIGRLCRRFEGQAISQEEIESSVTAAWSRFASARVRSFIPILVEHEVRDALAAAAAGRAPAMRA